MEENTREGASTVFQVYGKKLETVNSFKYLRCLLTSMENYWPEVVINIHKARKSWARMSQILGWYGADVWTTGHFYLKIVQAILLFG